MLAFRAHPKLTHAVMLAEVEAHAAADRYRTGGYWNGRHGCSIGCALHSASVLTGNTIAASDHSAFPKYFGIPERLAHLQDWCFENLPAGDEIEPAMDCSLLCYMAEQTIKDTITHG